MHKQYSAKYKSNIVTIFAGEFHASKSSDIFSTVLGSCIAVCLYDRVNGVRGINHFMLPFSKDSEGKKDFTLRNEEFEKRDLRYGIASMESLIAAVQKEGGDRRNLRAKVFGGGNVISGIRQSELSVGEKNIGFVKAFLRSERIPIESENVGGNYGRKMFFLKNNYAVFIKKVSIDSAVSQEELYFKQISDMKSNDDVTIF
ncbi:MAG: chemotaxis protein CheD [Spirochaetales bacterium]|nr:chemotaxis protein CheD [Spirochaetales bacterium]